MYSQTVSRMLQGGCLVQWPVVVYLKDVSCNSWMLFIKSSAGSKRYWRELGLNDVSRTEVTRKAGRRRTAVAGEY